MTPRIASETRLAHSKPGALNAGAEDAIKCRSLARVHHSNNSQKKKLRALRNREEPRELQHSTADGVTLKDRLDLGEMPITLTIYPMAEYFA
jgi:hypothetical protein